MPTSRRPAAAYVRFLELLNSMAQNSSLPALDSLELRMLRVVARAGYAQTRLSIGDMEGHSELGSHETVRSRLKSMQGKGWIELACTPDARRKQVVLTEAALLVLDALGTRLLEAVAEGRRSAHR
jgi:DNA-binding MarR family transcriptional regulator